MKLKPKTKRTLIKWLKQKDRNNWQDIYIREMTKLSESVNEEQFNRIVSKTINNISCKTLTKFRSLLKYYLEKET